MTTKLYNCFIIVLFYSQAVLPCSSHMEIFYLITLFFILFLVDTRPFCFVSGSPCLGLFCDIGQKNVYFNEFRYFSICLDN